MNDAKLSASWPLCLFVADREAEALQGLTGCGDGWGRIYRADLNNAGIWRETRKSQPSGRRRHSPHLLPGLCVAPWSGGK